MPPHHPADGDTAAKPPRIPVSRYVLVAAIAAVVFVVTQLAGQLIAVHNPLTRMRTFLWHDQLGYLAIAANVRDGDLSSPEPLTETGISHYPRLYYSLVGAVSRLTGLDVYMTWNIMGILFQVTAVIVLACVMITLSRRWWLGLLSPLLFLTGVFAYLQTGGWYIVLQAHAVLWGPYGALFSKNGESAGLSVGIIAVSLLMWTWCRPRTRVVRWSVTIIVGAAIGMLSAFQTYSFLITAFVVVFGTSATAIARSRRVYVHLAVSGALLVATALAGPFVAAQAGQLPTLVFGLLPAVPGLVLAAIQTRGLVVAAGVAALATALPQVLFTVTGVLDGDPFLLYRVASNHALGVVSWQALVGALPVLVPLLGVGAIGVMRREAALIGPALGSAVAFVFLAVNDLWGANAEPYRFWINGLTLGGVIAALCWSWAVRREDTPSPDAPPAEKRYVGGSRATHRVALAVLSATTVLYLLAFPDWISYITDDTAQASWSSRTEREQATSALASQAASTEDSLILPDLCVDPRTTKVSSGAPMAYYHLGMAWPAEKQAIDASHEGRATGSLDFDAMADADIGWIMTDSTCSYDWGAEYSDQLDLVAEREYTLTPEEARLLGRPASGAIRLWRVLDD
ncbi:hypothetical protein [Microbacterium sp. NPDC056569]|uniref:hypothetical protein n=1 Tax=Microbacterium sp. NPDC056569 TaxID=3345867 RepID=UPI00366F3766